jgi:HrpA-like RNA helicase
MEALDFWEEVTPLGSHLLELPLEPVLGKVLLHGVLLKCLDPVLSIVSCAAYRDPFQIPTDPQVSKGEGWTQPKYEHSGTGLLTF